MKEVFFQNACANHAWLWDFTIVGDLENLKCCCFSYSLRSFSRMSSNFHQAFDRGICDIFICSTFGEKHFCLLWLILFWEKRFPPEHSIFRCSCVLRPNGCCCLPRKIIWELHSGLLFLARFYRMVRNK